jgi:hypothetical protein
MHADRGSVIILHTNNVSAVLCSTLDNSIIDRYQRRRIALVFSYPVTTCSSALPHPRPRLLTHCRSRVQLLGRERQALPGSPPA